MKNDHKIKQAYDMIRIPDGKAAYSEVTRGEPVKEYTDRPIKVRRGGGLIAAAAAVAVLAGGVFAAYKLINRRMPTDIAAPGKGPTVVAYNGDIRITVSNIRCDGHILLAYYDYEKLYSDRSDRSLEFSINNRLHSIYILNSEEKGWSGWDEIMIERNNEGSNGDEVKDGDRVGVLNEYTESAEAVVSIMDNEAGTDTERLNKVQDMTWDLSHKIRIEKTCEAINFKTSDGDLMTVSELGIYGDSKAAERFHQMFNDEEDGCRFVLVDTQGREYDITDNARPKNFLFGADETDFRIAFPIELPVRYGQIAKIKYGDMVYTKIANAK